MSLATLRLPESLEGALQRGHPWIYREGENARARTRDSSIPDGSWVRVEAGRAAAIGLYARDGAIAVRLYRFAPKGGALTPPDDAWVAATVGRALAQRSQAALGDTDTDAYRLLNGEGDGLPGLTLDRYGRFALMRSQVAAFYQARSDAAVLRERVVRALTKALPLKGVVARGSESEALDVIHGAEPPPEITVRESGLSFIANLREGQKGGLFLDQRENRRTLKRWAPGHTVVNLFAYTGAFSMYALAGGAARAVDVDVAEPALRDAARHASMNGFAERHSTLAADLLENPSLALANPALMGASMIVLDPPSLARRENQRHAALRAYRKLNAAAMAALPAGGLLASASCTAQVSPDAFRNVLAEAASSAGVEARILHEAGQAPDHPVPVSFPEGRYLKFVLLRVDPAR